MADEEDDASKTEDPSEKKLGKAREQGQIASSQEVKNWSVLLGAADRFNHAGAGACFRYQADRRPFHRAVARHPGRPLRPAIDGPGNFLDLGIALLPTFVIFTLLALAAGLGQ